MGIHKNLSNHLRTFKKEHNLSLMEFSNHLGIGRTALQEYIQETGNPTLSTIEQIARGLGMTEAELLAAEETDE